MSTFRAQLRAGCKVVIDSVQTANPLLIAHTYDHRPSSFRTPCAFVDNQIRTPSVRHDASTRSRELVAEVHIVNKLVSNDQAADEQDVLSDLFEDAFTAAPRAASSSTLIEHLGVDGHAETDGDTSYACTVISVRGRIIEGRL